MRIKISKLGQIKGEVPIELKPLTIFVGPNNSGKTWTAFALAAIFGPRAFYEYVDAFLDNTLEDRYPPLDDALNELMEKGSTKIDLINFFNDYGEYYINNLAKIEAQWFQDFMGSTNYSFKPMSLKIDLLENRDKIIDTIKSYILKMDFSKRKHGEALLNISKEKNSQFLFLFTSIISDDDESTNELKERLTPFIIKSFIFSNVFRILTRSIFRDIYFFPAERAALGLIEKLFTTRDKQKGKEDKKTSIEGKLNAIEGESSKSIIIPDSVGNLVSLLESSKSGRSPERIRSVRTRNNLKKFLKLSDLLQQEILEGRLDYFDKENKSGLLFNPSSNLKLLLDMPIVSSMIKELSPLVLYLRNMADSRDLIIIDEPEMNLHPEAQAKMAEFLAMLVNAGVNVLATTHSPYIVDHLINLIKAANCHDPKSIEDKFYLKSSDAFISKDDVSVYLFGDGTAKNILEEDGFIEWETFNQVSQKILDLRMEL